MIPLLWRRAGLVRLALGVVALALAGGAVLGTQLTAASLHRQAEAAVRERAGTAQFDIEPFSGGGFTAAQVRAVAHLRAVATVAELARKPDLAELPSHAFRQVVLVVVARGGVALRPLPLVAGRAPRAQDQVAVSQALSPGISISSGAQAPGTVGVGQSLRLIKQRGEGAFRVVGVVPDSGPGVPFSKDAVYVTRAAARHFFAAGLQVTDLAVRLHQGATSAQLLHQLSRVVHTEYTVSNPRALPDSDPVGELTPILDGITALSLILAFSVIASTFSQVVLERRREVGLVRLAGCSRGLVFRSFLGEALAASLVGAALGVGVGYLVAAVLLAVTATSAPGPGVQVQAAWSLGAFLVVLVLGLGAAVVPAIQAALVPPLEALAPPGRPHPRRPRGWPAVAVVGAVWAYYYFGTGGPAGVGLGVAGAYVAACAVLAWLGPTLVRWIGSLLAPVLGTPVAAVVARSRTRPSRTVLAVGGLFVSVATATGLIGLSGAALDAGGVWVDHLFVGQYLVVSPVAQSQRVEAQLLATISRRAGPSGLVADAPVRFLEGRVGHVAVSLAATSATPYQLSGALQFVEGSRDPALTALGQGSGVLLPLQLAQQLGAHPGSRLRIVTATGAGHFRVAGVVTHTLPGPAGEEALMLDQATARHDFGPTAAGFDLLQLELRGGPDLGRQVALAAFRYGLESETVASVRQGVDQAVEHAIAALTALALVGVVIAVLAALNTVVLSSREGARDMALLRVVGLSRGEAQRAAVGEALATALTGCGLGIAAGVGLIAPEDHAATSAQLPLNFQVPWLVLLAVLAAVAVAIVIAALAPARQMGKRDPLAALAVE